MRIPLISFLIGAAGWADWELMRFDVRRSSRIVLGDLDPDGVAAAGLVIAVVGIGIAFFAVAGAAVRRRSPVSAWVVGGAIGLLVVPASGLALLFAWFSMGVSTPIVGDTHGRTLVVRESGFGWGDVFERHGMLLVRVGETSTDDFFDAFADGAYRIRPDANAVVLEWAFGTTPGTWYEVVLPDAATSDIPAAPHPTTTPRERR